MVFFLSKVLFYRTGNDSHFSAVDLCPFRHTECPWVPSLSVICIQSLEISQDILSKTADKVCFLHRVHMCVDTSQGSQWREKADYHLPEMNFHIKVKSLLRDIFLSHDGTHPQLTLLSVPLRYLGIQSKKGHCVLFQFLPRMERLGRFSKHICLPENHGLLNLSDC